jgi:cytochrome c556
MRSIRSLGPLFAAIAGGALPAVALSQDAQPTRAQQLIKYRQSMYTVMGANFGQLAAMASGKAPYDAKGFATRADRVAFMTTMLPEGFPEDSKTGAPTKAKPEIWANRAEFDQLMRDLQTKAADLARTAKTNDLEKIKPAFGAAGAACKACHDKFKAD